MPALKSMIAIAASFAAGRNSKAPSSDGTTCLPVGKPLGPYDFGIYHCADQCDSCENDGPDYKNCYSTWIDSSFMGTTYTACGFQPHDWEDGTNCTGNNCTLCKSGHSSYWYGKLWNACGTEPCWGKNTYCLAGTTCNACCNSWGWYWTGAYCN